MSAPGRLVNEDEFANIIVRETETGAQIRIKDVGRVDLGSQDYNSFGRLDGQPAGAMAVYLLPGANQLQTAEAIYETMRTAKTFFPADMDYRIVYDTTPAVEASIESIVHTFVEAIILVTLVVFIFLQNLRATIIPLLTVPVSLIGTFIFFPILGFSVNTLSMFGLVLAIGIVVDDAIVVVEAVMHHIEHGMSPHDATVKAMEEVSAPVIGIALILTAVFIPVAFIPGLTGRMYQQFALTIAISVLLSAFSALSLSPALAAMLLKPAKPATGILGKFFGAFNRGFDKVTSGYIKGAQILVRRSILTVGIVAVVAVGAGLFGSAIPAGFIPEEDQGIIGINVTLPAGASLERTSAVLAQVEEIVGKSEGVESYQTIGGYGVVTSTYQPNFGTIFVRLKPWAERHGEEMHVRAFMGRIFAQVSRIPEAIIFPFNIPTISGFGASAGFNFLLQDRSGSLSVERLGELSRVFQEAARKRPEIGNIFTSFDPRYPQVKVELDREKAQKLGVPVNEAFQTLATCAGRNLRERLQPVRAPVPRLRPGRLRVPQDPRGHRQALGAQQDHGRHDPAGHSLHHLVAGGDRAHQPFQPPALGGVQRHLRPWLRLRPVARRAGGGVQGDDAAGDGLRLLLALLPGEDGASRRTDPRGRHRVRLPAPGRHVRELAAALGGAARLAPRGPGLPLRGLAARLRQQRLRPDRQHHAHRPRRQERHPDRRVRGRQAQGRA